MLYHPPYNNQANNDNMIITETNQNPKKIRIPFKKEEDNLLRDLVERYGDKDWTLISSHMNGRTVRQCRERWQNNLSSSVIKTKWTKDEDKLLRQKYQEFGPRWKLLEDFFPGRTSYNIRNRWNGLTRLRKKSISHQKFSKGISSHCRCNNKSIAHSNKTLNENNNIFNIQQTMLYPKYVVPAVTNSDQCIFATQNNAEIKNSFEDEVIDDPMTDFGDSFFADEFERFCDKDIPCF